MITVTSTFAATPIVAADAHGPYVIPGGSPITLSAGVPHPDATYAWDLGDGTTATTPSVTHRYGDDGFYVAKLTVVVHQPGGARTRDFALIKVVNVAPTVDAGPGRTVHEGQVVPFAATFTDPEWLDSHEATWFWGDAQAPEAGTIVERHDPPTGQGTVSGSHAWGDSGTYTVTLVVRDDGGGVGRANVEVEVLNVAPTVHPLPPMFAYPCSVLTLTARFTDPGWLDSHIGRWDFGDGGGARTAVIRETHAPPAGEGVAIASHVYHRCGHYHAVCTVVDDDGAAGRMSTVVSVVQVENADFEHGFRGRRYGAVANHWEPYLAAVPAPPGQGAAGAGVATDAAAAAKPGDVFFAEELLVYEGERSQRIRFAERRRAGIRQAIGANAGWDYQVTVRYALHEQAGGRSIEIVDEDEPAEIERQDEPAGGTARLGVDPYGGADPMSPDIVWAAGEQRREWAQLAVRATAARRAITIFLEGLGHGRLPVDICFDEVELTPVQDFCPPPRPKPEEACADFSGLKAGARVPADYEKNGFRFVSADRQPQEIVAFGAPEGLGKLRLAAGGLDVALPFAADRVRLELTERGKLPVLVTALDAKGKTVGQAEATPGTDLETVEVAGAGIVVVRVAPRESVLALLVQICARREGAGG
jgi:PKD domain-containing protein